MAISRERLEELIKQGATIWEYNYEPFIAGYSSIIHINPLQLDNNCYIEDDKLYTQRAEERSDFDIFEAELKDIFETRKQAEWYLNYHATRTEELDLPMWEEFKKGVNIKFFSNIGEKFICYGYNKKITLELVESDGYEVKIKQWQATEENYEKACDLCLKLFKGEEEC